jgi:hypothetical protein
MEALFPKPQSPPEKQSRRRGRKPGKPLTARELSSRRANLAKARAASRGACRPTEKRLQASRANLLKAIAARRSPEGHAAARLNALKHGLFARRTVADSVTWLGEDPAEFERHLALFDRIFIPGNEEEKAVVRGLAETVWRRLRLFHAQARWEKERLHRIFAEAPTPAKLDLDDTVARANGLTLGLMEFDAFFREVSKLESQVEFWLRKLIRKRSHGKLRWKGFSPRRDSVMDELVKEEQASRFVEIWNTMSPQEQTAVWDEVQKNVDAKMAAWEREQGAGC